MSTQSLAHNLFHPPPPPNSENRCLLIIVVIQLQLLTGLVSDTLEYLLKIDAGEGIDGIGHFRHDIDDILGELRAGGSIIRNENHLISVCKWLRNGVGNSWQLINN